MAKQKDQGDLLEIFFDKERDSAVKFQKIIRNAILNEKKNILIDLTEAPMLPRDYLASLVLGAKSLKSYGYRVTVTLGPTNYSIFKATEDAAHFMLELAQVIAEDEMVPPPEPPAAPQPSSPAVFKIVGNVIHISDDEAEHISSQLGVCIQALLNQGHREVIADLTEVFLVTPQIIQSLILETLNHAALRIRIAESMQEVIQSNPQAAILNLEIAGAAPAITAPQPAPAAHKVSSLAADFLAEDMGPATPRPIKAKEPTPIPASKKEPTPIPASKKEPTPVPAVVLESLGDSFQVDVNCLRVGKMSPAAFVQTFSQQLPRLYSSGEQIYVDMSDYDELEEDVFRELIAANLEAAANGKKMGLRLLKSQQEKFADFLPTVQEVSKRLDTTPKFQIIGSRMEIYHVDSAIFLEKFSENFKKLMSAGQKNLVVDISHLHDLNDSALNLLILSYLEASGRGLLLTLRIRPEMEENFQKSGRGRALPLEVVRPDMAAKVAYHDQNKRAGVDMKKLQEAAEKDKLSDKVLKKQFDAVHIESRGTLQNWEPAPVKAGEREIAYTGTERRKDRRYKTPNIELAFAKGSLGKIVGRRYPLHNISQTGACFTSSVALSRGEPVRMKIFTEGEIGLEVSAKVIWSSPVPSQALFRAGVQFANVSEVNKIQLRELIGQLYHQQEATAKL